MWSTHPMRFHALAMFSEHSSGLLRKSGYNGVQYRNRPVAPSFWTAAEMWQMWRQDMQHIHLVPLSTCSLWRKCTLCVGTLSGRQTATKWQDQTTSLTSLWQTCCCVGKSHGPRTCRAKAAAKANQVSFVGSFAGKNLSVFQEEVELNVSASQDFTVPCQITRQSSAGSEFQVTWYLQKDTKFEQEPIFKVGWNSTQQYWVDDLRFRRPSPKQFNLQLLKLGPEKSGLYFCKVEEWVPSLSHGWRRVAVERSGNHKISIYTEGKHALIFFPVSILAAIMSEHAGFWCVLSFFSGGSTGSQCQSSTFLGILIPITLLLLFIIFLLVMKLCRNKVKKQQPSLWTEQHPLSTKHNADGWSRRRGEVCRMV